MANAPDSKSATVIPLVDFKVISEVQGKIERLKLPKGYTVRPVLIYSGVLASGIKEDGYFDKILDFDKLLTTSQN